MSILLLGIFYKIISVLQLPNIIIAGTGKRFWFVLILRSTNSMNLVWIW